MEKIKKVLSIISIIISFVLLLGTIPKTTMYKEIMKGQPTVEEYAMLREEILNYTKTLEDDKNDETGIIINTEIKDNNISITAVKEYRCRIKATYPITKTGEGIFKINYKEVFYKCTPQNDIVLLCLILIIMQLIYRIGTYYVLYFIVWGLKKIREKIQITIKK